MVSFSRTSMVIVVVPRFGCILAGNCQLCDGFPDLNLPSYSNERLNIRVLIVMLLVINAVLDLILVLAVVASCYWRRRSTTDQDVVTSNNDLLEEILFCHRDNTETPYKVLLNATDGFSSRNLIGVGHFSNMYKGVIDSDSILPVAVKVPNFQKRGASASFMAECTSLRSIRHRNLLKKLTSCYSYDSRGSDFRALVLEYMPNGSLNVWLHPRATSMEDQRRLGLVQRLNIATNVASTLDYLPHHASTPVIHCDLKPGNVLLDEDMCAHVGDFGFARIIIGTAQKSTSTTGLRGSLGYVPPVN